MRVVDFHVMNVNELVQMVFSGLSPLVVEDVADEGERIVVRARTPLDTAVCQVCGASSGRVHGYHWRTVADVPVDGRRVVVRVRVRRLVCPTRGCRHTFREQVPGVLERYQRRTTRLTKQVKAVAKELEVVSFGELPRAGHRRTAGNVGTSPVGSRHDSQPFRRDGRASRRVRLSERPGRARTDHGDDPGRRRTTPSRQPKTSGYRRISSGTPEAGRPRISLMSSVTRS